MVRFPEKNADCPCNFHQKWWFFVGFPWPTPQSASAPPLPLPGLEERHGLAAQRCWCAVPGIFAGDPYRTKCGRELRQPWTGWWFGTFLFFHILGNNHPNWLIWKPGWWLTNTLEQPWISWWKIPSFPDFPWKKNGSHFGHWENLACSNSRFESKFLTKTQTRVLAQNIVLLDHSFIYQHLPNKWTIFVGIVTFCTEKPIRGAFFGRVNVERAKTIGIGIEWQRNLMWLILEFTKHD